MLSTMAFVLAQSDSNSGAGAGGSLLGALFGGVFFLIWLGLILLILIGMWKVFVKAGRPGWEAIVPIYNLYILITKIAFRPWWWMLLFLAGPIPILGWIAVIVASIIISIDVAKNFGKDVVFAIGLALLGPIFYPILGFGSAKFQPVTGNKPPLPA